MTSRTGVAVALALATSACRPKPAGRTGQVDETTAAAVPDGSDALATRETIQETDSAGDCSNADNVDGAERAAVAIVSARQVVAKPGGVQIRARTVSKRRWPRCAGTSPPHKWCSNEPSIDGVSPTAFSGVEIAQGHILTVRHGLARLPGKGGAKLLHGYTKSATVVRARRSWVDGGTLASIGEIHCIPGTDPLVLVAETAIGATPGDLITVADENIGALTSKTIERVCALTVAFPLGTAARVERDARVEAERASSAGYPWLAAIDVLRGSSGGGVYDRNGHLLGVIYASESNEPEGQDGCCTIPSQDNEVALGQVWLAGTERLETLVRCDGPPCARATLNNWRTVCPPLGSHSTRRIGTTAEDTR